MESLCTVGESLIQPLWKIVWKFLKNLKLEIPYNSIIFLLAIYKMKIKRLIWKDTCTLMVIIALFKIANIWRQPKCSLIDKWIRKIRFICVYLEHYSTIKKNKIVPLATTWMDLQDIMLIEISYTKKDKYHMI